MKQEEVKEKIAEIEKLFDIIGQSEFEKQLLEPILREIEGLVVTSSDPILMNKLLKLQVEQLVQLTKSDKIQSHPFLVLTNLENARDLFRGMWVGLWTIQQKLDPKDPHAVNVAKEAMFTAIKSYLPKVDIQA